MYNYISPIYACQIQPDSTQNDSTLKKTSAYSAWSTSASALGERIFVSGGIAGQLIYNKRGWIIQKEKIIHEGEGPVECIRWKDQYVAWANEWGIKVNNYEYIILSYEELSII